MVDAARPSRHAIRREPLLRDTLPFYPAGIRGVDVLLACEHLPGGIPWGALVISAAMREVTSFRCPTCDAAYKVVRAEAPPKHDRELTCLSCGGPLRSREGKFVLKYFRAEGGQKK